MIRVLLASLAVGLFVSSASAGTNPNLVFNGSFEIPAFSDVNSDDGSGLYWYARPGNNLYPGWVNSNNPMGIVLQSRAGFWVAHDGNQYVEVESGYASFWQQSLATVPGQQYLLTFYYAANPAVAMGSNDDSMNVFWEGNLLATIDGDGSSMQHLDWTVRQYVVTATGAGSTLRFADGFDGQPYHGGYLDSVSVLPVPAPLSAAALVVAAAWSSRRRRV